MIVRPHIAGVRSDGLRSHTIWPHSLPPHSNTRTATFSAKSHTPSGTAARAGGRRRRGAGTPARDVSGASQFFPGDQRNGLPRPGRLRDDGALRGRTTMAKGILIAAFDFSGAHEDEFHDWYDSNTSPSASACRASVPAPLDRERQPEAGGRHLRARQPRRDEKRGLPRDRLRQSSVWSKRVTAMCQRLMRFEGEQILPGTQNAPDGAGACSSTR